MSGMVAIAAPLRRRIIYPLRRCPLWRGSFLSLPTSSVWLAFRRRSSCSSVPTPVRFSSSLRLCFRPDGAEDLLSLLLLLRGSGGSFLLSRHGAFLWRVCGRRRRQRWRLRFHLLLSPPGRWQYEVWFPGGARMRESVSRSWNKVPRASLFFAAVCSCGGVGSVSFFFV